MLYETIEKSLETQEGMTCLLDDYKEAFERIEYLSDLFKEGSVNHYEMTDKIMKELAAWYSSLNVVVLLTEASKKNQEALHFNSIRNDIEINRRGKVVASLIERKVSQEVSGIRRIRNIFQSYRDNCDRLISICQSSLKFSEREKGMSNT